MLLSSARWKYTCNKEKKFARKFTRKEERERERGSTIVKPQVLDRIRICSRTAPTKYLDTLFIDARRIVNVLAIKKSFARKFTRKIKQLESECLGNAKHPDTTSDTSSPQFLKFKSTHTHTHRGACRRLSLAAYVNHLLRKVQSSIPPKGVRHGGGIDFFFPPPSLSLSLSLFHIKHFHRRDERRIARRRRRNLLGRCALTARARVDERKREGRKRKKHAHGAPSLCLRNQSRYPALPVMFVD